MDPIVYIEYLAEERKRQNRFIRFSVSYCELLLRMHYGRDFDEEAFKAISCSKYGHRISDKPALIGVDDDGSIVYRGFYNGLNKHVFGRYERDASEFYVEQTCEADCVKQVHYDIFMDGEKSSAAKVCKALGIGLTALYKLFNQSNYLEKSGHVIERRHKH